MASPPDSNSNSTPESPRSILQRLISSRNRDLSLLFPFILGFQNSSTDPDNNRVELTQTETDPVDNSVNHPNPDESIRRRRLAMFNSLFHPQTDPDNTRVKSGESETDPVDNHLNHPTPDDSTRVSLFNSLRQPQTDPDNNRVESAQTETDPDTNSGNRSTPDELTRRRRMIMFNSLFRPETDPDNNRVESAESETDPDTNSENNRNPDESNRRERIVLFNPETQSMVVMEGIGLNSIFNNAEAKTGHPPATKSSVEELPRVEITEDGDEKGECVVCLEDFTVGNIVKKMPCQHVFHENCIEKWLGIHGSCPVCRYKMPVDDEIQSKNGRVNSEVWVRVSIGRARGRGSDDQTVA